MSRKLKKPSRAKLYREWRDAVREIWGYKCAVCGKGEPEVKLDTHHLVSKSIKGIRYDVRAAILLCSLHHHFDSRMSAHKGTLLFIKWLEKNYPEIVNYLEQKIKENEDARNT